MKQPSSSAIEYALIVAGGSGLRMKTTTPKQYLLLRGKPILVRTIEAFLAYRDDIILVVVVPQSDMAYVHELCVTWGIEGVMVVGGGETRFQSVKNGLDAINGDGVVAVHDGVRPLVPLSMIQKGFETAGQKGAAVPVLPLNDSIRWVDGDESKSADRSHFKRIQTPQMFDLQKLKAAFSLPYDQAFTDEATVFEYAGYQNTLYEGDRQNIKITTPFDWRVADMLLAD